MFWILAKLSKPGRTSKVGFGAIGLGFRALKTVWRAVGAVLRAGGIGLTGDETVLGFIFVVLRCGKAIKYGSLM